MRDRDILDLSEISRLIENAETDPGTSLEEILAEYSGSGTAPAASVRGGAYMPESDKELEKTIEGVVNLVLEEDKTRKASIKRPRALSKASKTKENREVKKTVDETIRYHAPSGKTASAGRASSGTERDGHLDTKVIRLERNADQPAVGVKKDGPSKKKSVGRAKLRELPRPEKKKTEITLKQAEKKHKRGIASLKSRGTACVLACLPMLYISAATEWGFPYPGSGSGFGTAVIINLCLHVLVMLLCMDRFAEGLKGLFTFKIGFAGLTALANVLAAADALVLIISKSADKGLMPVSAVCAMMLTASLIGEKLRRQGLSMAFKTASAVSEAYVVTAEDGVCQDGRALMKSESGAEGFVTAAEEPDAAERAARVVAPLMLILSLALALVSALWGKGESGFLHEWSVMTAVAVPLSASAAFSLPFRSLQRRLRHSGGALAGYGGAKIIAREKRVIITDRDVFPVGTVSLSGIKLMEGFTSERVISAAAALIKASGSNLDGVFSELMSENMYKKSKLESFELLDGGFGGAIDGVYVMCGDTDFMYRRGVAVPREIKVKSAVLIAFGTRLAAVFALNYLSSATVAGALSSMIDGGSSPLLFSNDFCVTPEILSSKFGLRPGEIELPGEEIKADGVYGVPAAVLCREGLACYADAVTGGRKLVNTVRLNIFFTVTAALTGVMLTFWLMFLGAAAVVTAGKIAVFALAWLIPLLLNSGAVTRY